MKSPFLMWKCGHQRTQWVWHILCDLTAIPTPGNVWTQFRPKIRGKLWLPCYVHMFPRSRYASFAGYLELQKNRPFFNRKSSFFRGDSPFFLHFQWNIEGKVGIDIYIGVWIRWRPDNVCQRRWWKICNWARLEQVQDTLHFIGNSTLFQ